jgi:phasin
MAAPGKYEIPNEMRDFADQSVEQARKAFEGFVEAAYKASNAVESQADAAQGNFRHVAGAAVAFAEQNMTASFTYAQRLVRAKSLEELMAIQAEFAKSQMETLSKQAREMGAMAGRGADAKS